MKQEGKPATPARIPMGPVILGVALGVSAAMLPLAAPPVQAQEPSLNLFVKGPYAGEWTKPWEESVLIQGHLAKVGCRYGIAGYGKSGSGWVLKGNRVYLTPAWKLALIVDAQTVHLDTGPKVLEVWFPYYTTNPDQWATYYDEYEVVEVDWLPTQPGKHEVRCSLDVGHVVSESVETDNSKATPFSVQGPLMATSDPSPQQASPVMPPTTGRPGLRPGNARSTTVRASPGVATIATSLFNAPSWNGKRVDLCLVWGGQCGEPAATEFCQRSGYAKASDWKPANDIGAQTPTVILSSGQVCSAASCDGFASITCSK